MKNVGGKGNGRMVKCEKGTEISPNHPPMLGEGLETMNRLWEAFYLQT